MIVSVPKEIKNNEYRVSVTPPAVETLTAAGHRVYIETSAGRGSGISDEAYAEVGAVIVPDRETVYREGEMVLKVKELFPVEFNLLREGQILFTFLHSANNPLQTQALLDRKVIAIAYEDIRQDDGETPLLTPMSEIAGEVGLLMGAYHMFTINGGSGLWIGGAAGSRPMTIAILGAGRVGLGAARCALGLGGDVTLMDVDLNRLRQVRQMIFPRVKTVFLNAENVRRLLVDVDLLINALKWPPGATGHIVTRDMLHSMKKGALIVDIACDPAGAIETCMPTTHDAPVYEVEGIRHFCVDNLPAAVARTASECLSNTSLPYVIEIADKGWLAAVKENMALCRGLSFAKGYLTFKPTAEVQNRTFTPAEEVIARLESPNGRNSIT